LADPLKNEGNMKKTLLATTMLVATAGVAAAETANFSLSGYGRFGLLHIEDRAAGVESTQVASRLRINIDATTETDTGVTFGARLRMQNTNGEVSTAGNSPMFWVTYEGLRVEVGNVNTAHDSVALYYDSEMGFLDSSFGDSGANVYSYDSNALPTAGYTGLFVSYSISDVNLRFSYVDPNQTVETLGVIPAGTTGAGQLYDEEVGISADWTNGTFAVAAAYTTNGAGISDNDVAFVGVAYTFNDAATVGLNWYDNGDVNGAAAGDEGNQWTLYGNYKMGATTLKAYVSDLDLAGASTAYGIGADYALADGVRISGSVQRGWDTVANEDGTTADIGVRFDF